MVATMRRLNTRPMMSQILGFGIVHFSSPFDSDEGAIVGKLAKLTQ